ncbi:MAG: DUF4291 domain-containing protein [Deltaproteobacteria bacterium]|nr:DUF4291 domain-containing protein [Deltaproteobacteria bacterium]
MTLAIERHVSQADRWPKSGRVILAQFSDDNIVVYQAFRPSIAAYAVAHGRFGGDFSFSRMSWIKPNFLWMMFRSGWASKEGQESVLAVTIPRRAFLTILQRVVHSKYVEAVYGSMASWKLALRQSDVRLQWDPDHGPTGGAQVRRAVQLGLSGETLRSYATSDVVSIEDISDFVRAQGELVRARRLDELLTPREDVFPVDDPALRARLGLDDAA